MFETTENKNVVQSIIEKIQNMILHDELKIGDKLPPERQLTEIWKVGRPALREALKALEIIGLIERKHGQGNFISNNINDSYYKPLSISFKLSNGSIEDLFDLREVLESSSVRAAAKKASKQDIKKLYKIYKSMINENNESKKAEFDKEFHYEIIKLSGNELFITTWNSLSYLMDIFIDKTVNISLYEEKSIHNIYEEHLYILKAIESHNPDGAEEALINHLKKIDIELLKKLK
ncbi:FadR/GntR family transcriptional regulator [Clostridium sp. AWRP]|uniref:FadR/GntR family transcriptional regulator n=1 Tax=Clostridium sp. AWRP TaxID=2212991 RepID=UPI000FD8175F|nr:FadR/GntR family transcriptional regulator [Clostridium sp. AWRP]AZV56386.1 FCD domain-containing protein [Clostridium sp. AWRP]